jgi:hypothetical protein
MGTTFKVIRDIDYGFVVADASIGAYSFAMVPAAGLQFSFATRVEAETEAKRLTGKDIPLRMLETPDRFEEVADTLYGPAWD